MFSVLWIWTPSLLAKACSKAVLPGEGNVEHSEQQPH